MNIPRNNLVAIGVFCIALVAIFFISHKVTYTQKEKGGNADTVAKENAYFPDPFATTSLNTKAIYVYAPAKKQVMYQKNASKSLPLASVTKIMTAYISSTILDDEDIIVIIPDDLMPDGESGLYPGEQWKFKDLRDIMLVASANDAAEAIRRVADEKLPLRGATTTIDIMNAKARELGLTTLSFESVTGLDIANVEATAYGSAEDIALLLVHIIEEKPEIFESTREASILRKPLYGSAKTYKNTNITVNDMPSIIASKTGFTDTAGGNVIAAFDAGLGSPIVIAILGSANQESRFTDLLELSEKALRYVNGTYYTEYKK
jgi:D-alanyl-D-alanine carboxypeptidase